MQTFVRQRPYKQLSAGSLHSVNAGPKNQLGTVSSELALRMQQQRPPCDERTSGLVSPSTLGVVNQTQSASTSFSSAERHNGCNIPDRQQQRSQAVQGHMLASETEPEDTRPVSHHGKVSGRCCILCLLTIICFNIAMF